LVHVITTDPYIRETDKLFVELGISLES